ncbi:response regulator transcription factor [Streptomyces rochei]|uniref:response regulator transcription factor n=1 Tax=Streptomyces TaxID=1883 RepID=UPI0002D755BA|nr:MULTISPECIES: response regulator transcription factor [Streptomyces]WMI58172.1 response regulator transcription factor [Streptomyces rochei]WQC14113.1 response regulator transcription factor [Streptomyces rochei]
MHDGRPDRYRVEGDARIRVLLAEDAPLIRQALTALLSQEPDLDIVAAVEHGDLIVPTALRTRPDVAVLDIDLPGMDGITAAVELQAKLPSCRSLLLTSVARPEHVRRALTARVVGFIRKDAPTARLAEDIRQVARGHRVVDPELALAAATASENPLTPREVSVLRLTAQGASTRDVAAQLYISVGTVRNHLASAVAKTQARSRVDAIRIATEAGWL